MWEHIWGKSWGSGHQVVSVVVRCFGASSRKTLSSCAPEYTRLWQHWSKLMTSGGGQSTTHKKGSLYTLIMSRGLESWVGRFQLCMHNQNHVLNGDRRFSPKCCGRFVNNWHPMLIIGTLCFVKD